MQLYNAHRMLTPVAAALARPKVQMWNAFLMFSTMLFVSRQLQQLSCISCRLPVKSLQMPAICAEPSKKFLSGVNPYSFKPYL